VPKPCRRACFAQEASLEASPRFGVGRDASVDDLESPVISQDRVGLQIEDDCGDLLDSRFSNNVVSFSRNVVLSGLSFSINLVPKPRMLSVLAVYVLSP